MEKYKPLILLVTAVVIALVTSILAYNWVKKETTVKETLIQTEPVAVAVKDLSWGTVLSKEMVKTVTFLKGSLPAGDYFTDPSSLQNRVLVSPVKANEPIFESRLAPDKVTGGGVAAIVNPDKRAMAVKVDKVTGVSGFIHPGNRVDVLVTITPSGKRKYPITKIVLQNIPVLAVGTEMEQEKKAGKAIQVDVITLELSPDEAEKLALATTQGKIQLALRNYNTTEEVSTRGATVSRLLWSKRPATRARKTAPVSESVSFNVEMLRGDQKTSKTFKSEQ